MKFQPAGGIVKLARFILFFTAAFTIVFVCAALLRWFTLGVAEAGNFPAHAEQDLTDFIAAARWALAVAVHAAVVLCLSYSARRSIFAPVAICAAALLTFGANFGIEWALDRAAFLPPARRLPATPSEPGLILTQAGASVVLLDGTASGPRVLAMDNEPLMFQRQPRSYEQGGMRLPRLPFTAEPPWFLRSMAIDAELAAVRFKALFAEGLVPFIVNSGALIFLLASLRFIFDLSRWPLANLFLGLLAVRGILALETFANSPEILDYLSFYLGKPGTAAGGVLSAYALPMVYVLFGVLVCLYTLLVSVVRGARSPRPHGRRAK